MNNAMKLNEGNKKREAFKRFSQMGVAGLAVCSMSAFMDVSAQELPDTIKNSSIKERHFLTPNELNNEPLDTTEVHWFTDYGGQYGNYQNYCNYYNYSNYGNSYNNYSNNYSNNYANNYSNYSDSIYSDINI
jgi:hypothetical protein